VALGGGVPETGETLMQVEFRDRGGRTEVVVVHRDFPEGPPPDPYRLGWESGSTGLSGCSTLRSLSRRQRRGVGPENSRERRRDTVPSASQSVTINRPASDVFAFVADGENEPKWRPGVLDIQHVSGQGVGAVYR
jgi:hypothetical protein